MTARQADPGHRAGGRAGTRAGTRTGTWAGVAAAVWALAFAALSAYWAAGGGAGAGTIGPAVEDLALARDPAFVAVLWVTALLKLLAAALALLLVHETWRGPVPRRLVTAAGWTTAVLLLAYGLANLVQHLLMWTGRVHVPAGLGTRALPWHLLLWDPVWIVGGLLFLLAAVHRASAWRGDGTTSRP